MFILLPEEASKQAAGEKGNVPGLSLREGDQDGLTRSTPEVKRKFKMKHTFGVFV